MATLLAVRLVVTLGQRMHNCDAGPWVGALTGVCDGLQYEALSLGALLDEGWSVDVRIAFALHGLASSGA